jgi:hypothetical protein
MLNVGQNSRTGGRMTSVYYKVYEAIITMERLIANAKSNLVGGESPYVNLSQIRDLAEEAKSQWHLVANLE